MKSVFNKIEKEKPKEIVFPVLAESGHEGNSFVVMFLSTNAGVCISSNNPDISVGEYDTRFIHVDHESYWRILSSEESIVLSND